MRDDQILTLIAFVGRAIIFLIGIITIAMLIGSAI